jgi:predicted Zn-dependent protease
MLHRLLAGVLVLVSLPPPLGAQTLEPPGEVVIYVHAGVRNTEFVEPLVCALTKVLAVPVRARPLQLALTPELKETSTQFSPRKIAEPFLRTTAGDSDHARPFRYFILADDLGSKPLNYVFAETYGGPYNLSVISVARLAPDGTRLTRKQAAETTERRVYKLMLKSVAIMSGLDGTGCVMMFPRSLNELNLKSAEYCPEDRVALVAARVLKEKPSESCSTVVAAR